MFPGWSVSCCLYGFLKIQLYLCNVLFLVVHPFLWLAILTSNPICMPVECPCSGSILDTSQPLHSMLLYSTVFVSSRNAPERRSGSFQFNQSINQCV